MSCKLYTSSRFGFSMLELVFVIVILGIVASIGSSIIVQVYESYIVQRAIHKASNKAELAAMQIANRLAYRISSSVIGRQDPDDDTTILPLDQVQDDTYTTLEWIAYDNDSFSAQATPGWSGYSDISDNNNTTRTNISTPGSDLDGILATIIGNLGGSVANDLALVFDGHEYNNTRNYDARCMGFPNSTCIFKPTITDATNLTLVDDGSAVLMRDQYKLTWTAYALVPSGNTLTLRYNYQPWNGLQSSTGSSVVLVDNFVSFRFKGNGDTVRFKLCIEEPIGDQNVTICKEKAVIR